MTMLHVRQRAKDEHWMREALRLARRGEGMTRPNPPVGAVVVRDGRLVARGFHRRAGGPHAEAAALRKAGARARGSTLYVTLEPCCTWGQTPPCTGRILETGVSRVVVGARDPNPRHGGRGLALLRRKGIRVDQGVCREEAERLIEPFKKWITTGRPFVTLKLAISLDGKIADRAGRSRWITGPAARREVHALRRRADAVLVGAGTALVDNPSLLPRSRRRPTVLRIVADSKGRLPPGARMLNDGHADSTIVATTRGCPRARIAEYETKGARVWVLPVRAGRVSSEALFRRLGEEGILHVVCEGGGKMAETLIRKGLTDELLFFIAPCIIGGERSASAVAGTGWSLKGCPRLRIVECRRVGRDVLLRARPA